MVAISASSVLARNTINVVSANNKYLTVSGNSNSQQHTDELRRAAELLIYFHLKGIPFGSNNFFLSLLIRMDPVFNIKVRTTGRGDMGDKNREGLYRLRGSA